MVVGIYLWRFSDMGRKDRRKIGGRPYRNYTDELLASVLKAIKDKKISVREAAKRYGIHRNTISNKLKEQKEGDGGEDSQVLRRKPGRQTALSEYEEKVICAHTIAVATYGFPMTVLDLRIMVKNYLDRVGRTVNAFTANMPGAAWGRSFRERHSSQLSQRMSQSISRYRAGINSTTVNEFFDNIEVELEGISPEAIWNYDETNLTDDPGSTKILCRRGAKHPELIQNATKVSTSIMVCGNAAGEIAPLYVVYKADNVYPEWVQGAPPSTRFNRSKSGWFDTKSFEDWFEFTMLPVIRRQHGTKVLMGDNLSSHLSSHVITLCERNDVKFIALPPNSTHLLQPLDVGFFGPLKRVWKTVLGEWKKTAAGRFSASLPKTEFPRQLAKMMETLGPNLAKNMKSGFKGTGIFPLNRDHVLQKLCDGRLQMDTQVTENVTQVFIAELQRTRQQLTDKPTRKRTKKVNVAPGKAITVADLQNNLNAAEPSTSVRTETSHCKKKQDTTAPRKRRRRNSETSDEEELSEGDIPYAESEDSFTDYFESLRDNNDDETDDPKEIHEAGRTDEEGEEERVEAVIVQNESAIAQSDPEEMPQNEPEPSPEKPAEEKFVIVQYSGKLYPGLVMSNDEKHEETEISAMKKRGKFWTWPNPPDVVWYRKNQIKGPLNPPQKIGDNLYQTNLKS